MTRTPYMARGENRVLEDRVLGEGQLTEVRAQLQGPGDRWILAYWGGEADTPNYVSSSLPVSHCELIAKPEDEGVGGKWSTEVSLPAPRVGWRMGDRRLGVVSGRIQHKACCRQECPTVTQL